jgi:exodeoxyribonuclease III
MRLKLISWNVNGIRAVQRKSGFSFLEKEKPDLLCLQETRAGPDQADGLSPRLRHQAWNPGERPGYSGTAVYSRLAPLSVRTGIGVREHDREGRVVAVELEKLFVVSVYTPNSRRDLSRLPYRARWDRAFLRFLRALQAEKPVLFSGDINVAHQEIDLARPRENRGTHGFTDQERAGFSAILRSGFSDTFRELHPDEPAYTWWNVATGSRARNVGWRIDYVVISQSLRPALRKAFILPEVTGSDHCPVGVVLEL